jgi:hypothetical protein
VLEHNLSVVPSLRLLGSDKGEGVTREHCAVVSTLSPAEMVWGQWKATAIFVCMNSVVHITTNSMTTEQ